MLTPSVLLGLSLQLLALALMHAAIRGRWLKNLGALLLLAAFLYQGVTEVVQWLVPNRNPYRRLVTQEQIDAWVILVSCAMLAYTIAYVIAARRSNRLDAEPCAEAVNGLRLWWLLPLTLPLIIATIQGRGALGPGGLGSVAVRDNYVLGGIALQFLVYLVAVSGVVAIVHRGPKAVLPVLISQALVMSLSGARSLIVVGAVTAVLLVGISASRAVSGRESFGANAGFTKRLTALMDGFAAIPTVEGRQAITNDFVYRFDGNTFGALVLNSLDQGAEPVGLTTARNNVFLAIPSFLNPNKLDTSLATRNEEFYFDAHFGLPYPTDYLPGVFGTLIGYFGRAGLFLLSALLGMAFAAVDIVIFKKCTPARLLLGLGVLSCVLLYETGAASIRTFSAWRAAADPPLPHHEVDSRAGHPRPQRALDGYCGQGYAR